VLPGRHRPGCVLLIGSPMPSRGVARTEPKPLPATPKQVTKPFRGWKPSSFFEAVPAVFLSIFKESEPKVPASKPSVLAGPTDLSRGMPSSMKKQVQQEEPNAIMDEQEHQALQARLAARAAAVRAAAAPPTTPSKATSNNNSKPTGGHARPIASGRPPLSGRPTSVTTRGAVHSSARLSSRSTYSSIRARAEAETARKREEEGQLRERQRLQRERARRAAQKSAREAAQEERFIADERRRNQAMVQQYSQPMGPSPPLSAADMWPADMEGQGGTLSGRPQALSPGRGHRSPGRSNSPGRGGSSLSPGRAGAHASLLSTLMPPLAAARLPGPERPSVAEELSELMADMGSSLATRQVRQAVESSGVSRWQQQQYLAQRHNRTHSGAAGTPPPPMHAHHHLRHDSGAPGDPHDELRQQAAPSASGFAAATDGLSRRVAQALGFEQWHPDMNMAFVNPAPPPPRDGTILIGRTGVPFAPGLFTPNGGPPVDWEEQMESGTVPQICKLMRGYGPVLSDNHAYQCLCAARNYCFLRQQPELVRCKGHDGVIECMRAHASSDEVQMIGCEVLGLLAGGNDGLEQAIFEAGALQAALDACEAFPESEGVLGAAFQAVSNVCFAANGGDDQYGCARKRFAVELCALEVISDGMQSCADAKWVQEAGVVAVGGLCNGLDYNVHDRRWRAKETGAIGLALRAIEEFPPALATSTHAVAYRAACETVHIVDELDSYTGPQLA
jgi:hypothetical protein